MTFQAMLSGLKGMGGAFGKGVGSSYGLPFDLTKVTTVANPATGGFFTSTVQPSNWQKISAALGSNIGSAKAPSIPSTSLPSVDKMPNLISPLPKDNIVSKKIKELAERIPGASWFMPDPYDLTSYLMPIGGLTRLKGARKLVAPYVKQVLSSSEREGLLTSLRAWLKTPKNVQKFVKDIKVGPVNPENFSWYQHGRIGLRSAVTDPETTIHEILHAAQDRLLQKKGITLQKVVNREIKEIQPYIINRTSEGFPEKYSEGFLKNLGYDPGYTIPSTLNFSTRELYRRLVEDIDNLFAIYKLRK